MNATRRPPDDPQEWLSRAKSSLAIAREGTGISGARLEDLCFQAQQAAEKALKGLLIYLHQSFPPVHNLAVLVSLLEKADQDVPNKIRQAVDLSDYAVAARYPGAQEPITQEEHEEAVSIAEEVVQWAERIVHDR